MLWAAPALQGSLLGLGPSGHAARWQQPRGTVPRAGDGRVGSCCHVTEGEGWLKLIEFAALLLFTTQFHPSEEPAVVSVDKKSKLFWGSNASRGLPVLASEKIAAGCRTALVERAALRGVLRRDSGTA